jgi:hypothetical protein
MTDLARDNGPCGLQNLTIFGVADNGWTNLQSWLWRWHSTIIDTLMFGCKESSANSGWQTLQGTTVLVDFRIQELFSIRQQLTKCTKLPMLDHWHTDDIQPKMLEPCRDFSDGERLQVHFNCGGDKSSAVKVMPVAAVNPAVAQYLAWVYRRRIACNAGALAITIQAPEEKQLFDDAQSVEETLTLGTSDYFFRGT